MKKIGNILYLQIMARCGTVEFTLTAGMVIGGFIMIICGFTVVREYDLSKVKLFKDNFSEIVNFQKRDDIFEVK